MPSSSSPTPGNRQSPSFAVASPADILSYVPHALGFMPARSLVVLTTTGRRLGATLRVDLPPGGTDPLGFAEGVLSFLLGDADADGTLLIVYGGEEWPRLGPAPHEALVSTLGTVLEAAGLPVRDGWFVSAAGWRNYFCRDDDCCPWPGEPLDAVASSALGAELVFGGSAFDASAPEAVLRGAPAVAAVAAGGTTSERELRAVEDAQAHFAAACSGRWTSAAQFIATSAVWDAVLLLPRGFETAAHPDMAGFLLASIESRTIRDFLLASACLGSTRALDGAAACGLFGSGVSGRDGGGTPGGAEEPTGVLPPVLPEAREAGGRDAGLTEAVEGIRAALSASVPPAGPRELPPPGREVDDTALLYADVLAGRFTGTIAWHRVDAMAQVLARLAAVSDGESRAAALTMSAWFEYARGRGSRAAVFLEAAELTVPGYRLARLLSELLRRGGLPAWARRRSTAWTADAARTCRGVA
jgi:hypothetical protein